jgi:hypothetical protein
MKRTVSLRLVVAALFVLSLIAPNAGLLRAEIPKAEDPKAFTEHDYRRELLKFNLIPAELYKQIGRRDPKWDEHAIALLEGVGHHLTDGPAEAIYQIDPMPREGFEKRLRDLESRGRKALEAGCDDPMVLDFFCIVLDNLGKDAEAKPISRRAVEGMLKSQYPHYRAMSAANRARRLTNQKAEPQEYEKFEQIGYDCALATIAQDKLRGIERRFFFSFVSDDLDRWPIDRTEQFYQGVEQLKKNAWLSNMIGGVYHIKKAWSIRGTGWAQDVRPEAWEGFGKHLEEARVCLTAAWKAQPDYPEAPARMITVVMGGSERPGETPRTWFDRAAEAQLDHPDAYTALLSAMMPRWGGSHQQMYEFGLECAQTKRYDTRVPWQFVRALYQIRDDRDGSWDMWRVQGVFEQVREVIDAYADGPKTPPHTRAYYCSQLAGIAWQLGRYDDGRAAMEKIQWKYDPSGLRAAGVMPQRTVSGLHAMTAAHGKTLLEAEEAAARGEHERAQKAYEDVARQLAPDDRGAEWVRGRAQEHAWQAKFAAGQWVDLVQSEDLGGWEPVAGEWKVENGALVGTTDGQGLMLLCGAKFGTRYEFRGTVEVIDIDDDVADAGGGPVFGHAGGANYCALWFQQHARQLGFRYGNRAPLYTPCDLGQSTRFHIRGYDGQAEAWINDIYAMNFRPLWQFARGPDVRLGVGSGTTQPGVKVRFSQLQVRKPPEPFVPAQRE